jgi:hypothetical protein
VATEKERAKGRTEAEAAEKTRWAEWVALQEEAGYRVEARDDRLPVGFDNVRVVPASDDVAELGDGMVYDDTPGA